MLPTTLAIVDDEPRMTQILAMVLGRMGHEVTTFNDPKTFLDTAASFDLVLTDLKMPNHSGLDILHHVKQHHRLTQVIVMTAHGTVETAIEALKAGAFDYIQKPFDNQQVKNTITRALEVTRLQRENAHLRAQLEQTSEQVIAIDEVFQQVLNLAQRAARSNATVLITGESGTGKEVLARTIHIHSPRVAKPFVAVNCKALATGVLESELFGHQKGAFTGATQHRKGLFEQANGGTLFLDEIGELDLNAQTKLLRVLQDGSIRPVGANRAIQVDARIVCATNRDLEAMVAEGTFREDLYYRLAVIPLHIPPLRARPKDIIPLARQFFLRINAQMGRDLKGWQPEVASFLLNHDWPGNVRQLENLIERAIVLTEGPWIEMDDFLTSPRPHDMHAPMDVEETLQEYLDRCTALKVRHTLSHCEGKRAQTASLLGVERTTLYRMLKRMNASPQNPK